MFALTGNGYRTNLLTLHVDHMDVRIACCKMVDDSETLYEVTIYNTELAVVELTHCTKSFEAAKLKAKAFVSRVIRWIKEDSNYHIDSLQLGEEVR